jgi:glycerol-3-phosphate dehydrogenase
LADPARFDLAIIGAGVNGAGIARDAALRGLKVAIFDKSDMCTGCSAISSRLVHGGLRYLEYAEIPLVYESLHERRSLLRIAPHLVRPLRICVPIYEGARRGPWLIRLGMLVYDILSFRKAMPWHDMLSADAMRDAEPGLNTEGLRAGACYHDAQVTFAERLVLENLLAARAAGADIHMHSEVTRIEIADGAVTGLTFEDSEGREYGIEARVVVNAAGPWVDRVLGMTATPTQRLIGGTKGSHIVVGAFDGAPRDAFYVEAAADGRPFFIIPWFGQYLIGTTDIRCDEDLDEIRASDAEVEYLLSETNRVFPSAELSRDDIHYAYAGVRPLPYKSEGPESAITRRHIVKRNDDVATGLVSIIGGKLTTYRNLAEQTVDEVGKLLQRKLPECRTADTGLPGAWGMDAARDRLAALEQLSSTGIERLLDVYGGRAAGIAEICENDPAFAGTLDDERTVLAAEVVFAIREEFAGTLEDIVFRRMMVGLGPDQGRALYDAIAALAAAEAGWDPEQLEEQCDALRRYAASLRVE